MRFGITPNFGAGAIYQTTIASTDTDEEGLLCTMTGCLRSVNDDSYLEILIREQLLCMQENSARGTFGWPAYYFTERRDTVYSKKRIP